MLAVCVSCRTNTSPQADRQCTGQLAKPISGHYFGTVVFVAFAATLLP